MTRQQAVDFLLTNPYKLGHLLGFTRLTELHNGWIKEMIRGKEDKTLGSPWLLQDHLRVYCLVADCGIAAELQNALYAKDGQ